MSAANHSNMLTHSLFIATLRYYVIVSQKLLQHKKRTFIYVNELKAAKT